MIMRKTSAGFTLVEVMLALLLLAIGVLAAAPMFVYAMKGNAGAGDFGVVGALAVERMELLRGEDYSDLDAGGSLTANTTVGGVDYFDTSNDGYVLRWTIADGSPIANTKTIAVRAVALRQVIGQQKEVTLTTVRGR